jgi:ABC-type sugar transport system substrate-binding protein
MWPSRKRFAGAALALLLAPAARADAAGAAQPRPPNIVFILADDKNY